MPRYLDDISHFHADNAGLQHFYNLEKVMFPCASAKRAGLRSDLHAARANPAIRANWNPNYLDQKTNEENVRRLGAPS